MPQLTSQMLARAKWVKDASSLSWVARPCAQGPLHATQLIPNPICWSNHVQPNKAALDAHPSIKACCSHLSQWWQAL